MKLIFVGREDHLLHATVKKFIELGKEKGHIVKFCTLKEFMSADLKGYDVICLKIGQFKQKVWDKLENYPDIRVVNNYTATKAAENRILVNEVFEKVGMKIPAIARDLKELEEIQYPIIVKSIDGQNHEMKTYHSRKELPKLNFFKKFYQEIIPNDGFDYKYYIVGDNVFCLQRPANQALSHLEKVHEKRVVFCVEYNLEKEILKLRKRFDLDIFGIDFLKHSETNEYYAIDLNLFPGFIGLPEAPSEWLKYIESLV